MSTIDATSQSPLNDSNSPSRTSFFKTISYSMTDFNTELVGNIFGMYLFLFWETEIKLDPLLISIGYTIYAIWNAINDPLIGFLTDKPRKYWTKTGKRFPLILMAGIPFGLLFVLIFNVPAWDPVTEAWKYFIWFVLFTCIYDLFYSVISLNHSALFPDLFNNDRDRRTAGGIRMFFLLIGSVVAALIAPMFVIYNNRNSYGKMAWVFAAVGIVLFLCYLPGHFESKSLKQRYTIEQTQKQESFLKTLKFLLTQKNFMIVVIIFFLDGILGVSLSASIQYVVKYNLQLESESTIFVMAGWIAGALLSLFPWLIFSQKFKNNRKMMILGVFLNCVTLILCGSFWDLPSLVVGGVLLGIGGSALRIARNPVMADVMDECLVKSGHHIESSLMGIYTFFNRFSLIFQGWIFGLVHVLTQFDPNVITQTPLALFGIRMHTAFIPAALCLIGLILFIKIYNLTPEKTKLNQEIINEKML